MNTILWMTPVEVAAESRRHVKRVGTALRAGLLTGVQDRPGACWRISRKAFAEWMAKGAPVDTPARARMRRAS